MQKNQFACFEGQHISFDIFFMAETKQFVNWCLCKRSSLRVLSACCGSDNSLQIRALLFKNSLVKNGSFVGDFAVSMAASGKKWDVCLVLQDLKAQKKKTRSNPQKMRFVEVMYRNGMAKLYNRDLIGVELFTYKTLEAYLKDCQLKLPVWASDFQYGFPKNKGEDTATDEFLRMWAENYNMTIS